MNLQTRCFKERNIHMRKPFGNDPGIFLPYWIFAVSHDPEELNIALYALRNSPNRGKEVFSLSNGKFRRFFPEFDFWVFSTARSLTEVFQLAERLGKIPIEVRHRPKLDTKFEKLIFETSWKAAMGANCPK